MGHDGHCEKAEGNVCVCPCGNALHGAVLAQGIVTADVHKQGDALAHAEPHRWVNAPDSAKRSTVDSSVGVRQVAVRGVIDELVVALIGQVRDTVEFDAAERLADEISREVGRQIEENLAGGRPEHRSNLHLWCVVLATICRVYDESTAFLKHSVDDLVDAVVDLLEQESSQSRGTNTRARDIYQHKHVVVPAFEPVAYAFLRALIKHALAAVTAAMIETAESTVMKYLRLIGAITCPDPDRHPDVVKYCIWPLLSGPFQQILGATLADEMRVWVRNAYESIPSN